MSHFSISTNFPNDITTLSNKELNVNATHFTNAILLQIRLDGEMNSTYEVSQRVLRPLEQNLETPLAGYNSFRNGGDDIANSDEEETLFVRDSLSDYQVTTKLGDPNDAKIPVVCTQIAELYQRVILPTVSNDIVGNVGGTNLVITLSSKIWDKTSNTDFQKLVFILKTIKEMYSL